MTVHGSSALEFSSGEHRTLEPLIQKNGCTSLQRRKGAEEQRRL
jgi:hypothetical protein